MFELLYDLTNTQAVADMLKAQIERTAPSADRSDAIAVLQRFERSSWIPQAFEDAAVEADGTFEFDGDQLVYVPSDNSASEIAAVLTRYLDLVAPTEQIGSLSDLFTTKQAADYLNLTERGVRKHIYETKRLHPARQIGRALMFTKDELDRFARDENRKRGPKPKGASERA